MNGYLLMLLVFSPLLGMAMLAIMPKTEERTLKQFGFFGTLPPLMLTLFLCIQYYYKMPLSSFDIKVNWIRFGNLSMYDPNLFAVDFELGLDGLSLVFLLLTTVIASLSSLAASYYIKQECKGYYLLLMLLEIGMLGVFTADNLLLFFIFLEMTLLSAFFLIGRWGFLKKEKAAYQYLIYNGVGSSILLTVILILFARTGTTNLAALTQMMTMGGVSLFAPISVTMKDALCLALLLAFVIKLPIFPFHSWMVRVQAEAPPTFVMIHAGILLNMSAYGIIRFGIGIFPEQYTNLAFYLVLLGAISMLYGAFLALLQTDLKLVLTYLSVSQLGLVLMGLGTFNEKGMLGAILLMVSHGLIASCLFFLVAALYARTGTTTLAELSGIKKARPRFFWLLFAGGLASLGVPGLSGFISEYMIFHGLFKTQPVIAPIGMIGLIVMAVSMLRAGRKLVSSTGGRLVKDKESDLERAEWVPTIILLGLIAVLGVYPDLISGPLQGTIDAIMLAVGGR